jgi:hypothetical protein
MRTHTHQLKTLLAPFLAAGVLTALLAPSTALAAGDASQASACPNESLVGFSVALPECRGFELVTPPYEAGEEPGTLALSADGSHLISKSLGTYSGRQNGSTEAAYLAGRGGSGWGSVALSPASSLFPAQQYWTASSDLSRSLWRFRSTSEPITGEDLYLRESGGALVKIGSLVPPADEQGPAAGDDIHFYGATNVNYQDASSDLSHVLFDIKKPGPLWPFDTTIPGNGSDSSLYEYSGTGATQPTLVGVSDGNTVLNGFRSNPNEPGELVPVHEVLPAGHLISDCQTQLGSEREEGYNAMSANGNTVFFTAAGVEGPKGPDECETELVNHSHGAVIPYAPVVNELFARVGGVETVPVSEPAAGVCVSCQVGEPERAGEFAGASEDGSRVFFLSEQEYFPGDVGKNLFEYNFDAPAGEHLLQVSGGEAGVLGVARVSEDGSHVYFVATGVLAGNANRYGRVAEPEQPNLYMFLQNTAHPTGEVVFITPLSSEDRNDWAKSDATRRFDVTPDGGFAVFRSYANVAASGGVVEEAPQIFEFSAGSGELVQVSRGQAGFVEGEEDAVNAGAEMPYQTYITSGRSLGPARAGTELAVSGDGSLVVFSSGGALTELAVREAGARVLSSAAESDVYVFHSVGGVLSSGEVYLVSARAHFLEGVDASGDDVFFKAPQQLVPFDGDGAMNIYDAHIDGGVPAAPTPTSCEGEGCLGAPGIAPALAPPTSATITGSGNLTPPALVPAQLSPPPKPKPKVRSVKCKRGEVRRGAKCVRKLKPTAKKSNSDRRSEGPHSVLGTNLPASAKDDLCGSTAMKPCS